MFRSIATVLLAATGIAAIHDGDFGTWRVVVGEQTCTVFGCTQPLNVYSDGNAENKLPGFTASCSTLGGCTVEGGESDLEYKGSCVPGSVSIVQTVENATNVWAAWGYAPWQSGKAGEFTIPVSKLHVYGE